MQETLPAAEAVTEAKRRARTASKPIVIADTQDNPGGGGHGDTTGPGPMGAGNPGNLGPCTLIDIDGIGVMVVSHKMQALD